jgi:membrane protease YdiL (CAAX protease family)
MWFALECVLAGWLIVAVPLVGRRRYRTLRAAVAADASARLTFYRRSAARQWLLAALAAGLVVARGRSTSSIGLAARLHPSSAVLPLAAALGAAVVVAIVLAARRPRWTAESAARMAGSVAGLLPATRTERRWFAVVAVTAGVTEEVLYRGFLTGWLLDAAPGLTLAGALALSSVAFGLGHVYQGLPGVAATGVVGLGLATVYAATGTLLIAMAAHAALDLRTLVVRPARRAVQTGSVPTDLPRDGL